MGTEAVSYKNNREWGNAHLQYVPSFCLSVKEPALQAGTSSTGTHTRKGNLEPKNNLQSPKGDWVKRCSSQKNHTPGRTNKVQVIPEPRLVLRWAMPCFLASCIPTAPLCSRHQTKHLGIQGVHSLVNETETICEQNCYKKDCLTSHLLARL